MKFKFYLIEDFKELMQTQIILYANALINSSLLPQSPPY